MGKPFSVIRQRLLLSVVWLPFCFLNLFASERLPLTVYSSADGLASSVIHHIGRDSQGFLWFCARGGLSRFDGYEFTSYRFGDDQASVLVHYFLETRDGTFWIATDAGLYRVKPQEKKEILPAGEVLRKGERRLNATKVSDQSFFTLFEDRRGRIWAGGLGLFLIENLDAERVTFRRLELKASSPARAVNVVDFTETDDGSVWAANSFSLVRILPDERIVSYEVPQLTAGDETFSVMTDRQGKIWFAHITGIFVLRPGPPETPTGDERQSIVKLPLEEAELGISGAVSFPTDSSKMLKITVRDVEPGGGQTGNKFGSPVFEDLYQSTDGRLWLPTRQRLYYFEDEKYHSLRDSGLLPGAAKEIAEDTAGNLWFGTFGGAIKYNRNGLITYNESSGLPNPIVHLIADTPTGEVLAFHGNWHVSRWTEDGFESVQLDIPESLRFSWTSFPMFADRTGAIWALTVKGLFRYPPAIDFPALAKATPQRYAGAGDRLKDKPFYRAFSDGRRAVWFSVRGNVGHDDEHRLYRYDLETGEWEDFTGVEGYPKDFSVVSFARDNAGNLWFGVYGSGGLYKYSNNRFTAFKSADGLPAGSIFALLVDRKGRLWLGSTGGGLARVDDPAAEKPSFVRYTVNDGLAADNVRCLAEDSEGNIYAGTVRGVSVLNPETGAMRHITTADGLAADFVHTAFRDVRGAMWFGTANGVSKYSPSKESAATMVAPVFISDLRIAGVDYTLSEFGQREVGGIEVSASENNLQINFSSVGEKEKIKYQYRLEGAAQPEWSAPSEQRTVNFANLAPGTYRFLARTVDDSGKAGEAPAVVAFTIKPPFWKTWWFVALMAIFVTVLIFSLDRYRVAKTRQVEAALDETRRAAKLTRESETRYRTLAETASDAIITIDSKSNIVYINDAAETIFGYAGAELIGKPLAALMPERYRPMHEAGINRYLSSARRNFEWSAVELQGLHKSGREIPLELSFGEFEKDGERFFTGIARDITERKKSEAALQKAREERLAELQRVRTRIATDLHDDIGSSLTQIAVFSEVARQRERQNGSAGEPLDMITNVANELVDTMSDIVWAINPKKDHLQDLTQRMRRFAANVLTAKEIDFDFEAPASDHEIPLGANIRREVFLIFKETVNNIVNHSGATGARIAFTLEEHYLSINFSDNGKGFDPQAKLSENGHHDWKKMRGGNGLHNMRRRAEDLGGEYEIRSEIGKGTNVKLKIPLEVSRDISTAQ